MYNFLDEVLAAVNDLICDYGAFHVTFNITECRVSLRFIDQPFYTIYYHFDEIVRSEIYRIHPKQPYKTSLLLAPDHVSEVLGYFVVLFSSPGQQALSRASLNVHDASVLLIYDSGDSIGLPALQLLEHQPSNRFGT